MQWTTDLSVCICVFIEYYSVYIIYICVNKSAFHNAVVLAIIAITIIGIAGFMIFRINKKILCCEEI